MDSNRCARAHSTPWVLMRHDVGMSEPLPLNKAIERLLDGTIRIPGFQRKYVWEPQRAAVLMDSLYKGFPVGSILLWRTRNQLKTEKRLGIFDLPPPDKDYPIDYVLDGQQRLTSIFSTFQTALPSGDPDPDVWLPIFYDFNAERDAQDSRFVALMPDQADPDRFFPLSIFFDAPAFSRATRDLPDSNHEEIVKVQQAFLTTLIPVETFESEDRASVAIVFERVNRMGVELDVFQLLTAWTWSDEFDLQVAFQDLAGEFASFGFESVGSDSDLMLRCCSAVLQQDPAPSALVNLNGGEVRDSFDVVQSSIRRAIDYVRTNFNVRHVKLLPYEAMLVPLAAFFSVRPNQPVTGEEHAELKRWFWRTAFSHRYSGNPQRNIKRDIERAVELRLKAVTGLSEIPCEADPGFFTSQSFNIRTVSTKTFILMLADLHPLTFLSGEMVELDEVLAEPNRSEYHHCVPRGALLDLGFYADQIDVLANFAIISRAENRTISKKLPSAYRELMPADVDAILGSALIPPSLFLDNYELFLGERAEMLAARARTLIQ